MWAVRQVDGPVTKFGLNVEHDDAIHTHRGYDDIDYVFDFSGENSTRLLYGFEMAERARKGDWLGVLLRFGFGVRVRVLLCREGLVWFESSISAKGGSIQSFLSACPDMGTKGRG